MESFTISDRKGEVLVKLNENVDETVAGLDAAGAATTAAIATAAADATAKADAAQAAAISVASADATAKADAAEAAAISAASADATSKADAAQSAAIAAAASDASTKADAALEAALDAIDDIATPDLASPGPIGATTPASATFTVVTIGSLLTTALPTSDPLINGAVWNDGGTLKVSTFTGASLAVTWTGESGINTGYKVRWSVNDGADWTEAEVGDVEEYTITGLPFNTLVMIEIIAIRTGFPDSDALSAEFYTAPEFAPTSFAVDDIDGTTVSFTFTEPAALPISGGYRIKGKPTAEADYEDLADIATGQTTGEVEVEEYGTEYQFVLVAYNSNEAAGFADSETAEGTPITATTDALPAPSLVSATLSEDGEFVDLVFSREVSFGTGGDGGFALTMSGGAVTATSDSGEDTDTITCSLSRPILWDETGTVAYTNPGNGLEGYSDGADVASFSGVAITNGSQAHDYLFKHGFEASDTETWTLFTGGFNQAGTAVFYEGSRAATTSTNNSGVRGPDFAAAADCWVFGMFRCAGLPTADTNPISIRDSSNVVLAAFTVGSGGAVKLTTSSASTASAFALSVDTWYAVWLHWVSGGTCELFVSASETRPTVDGVGGAVRTRTGASGNAVRGVIARGATGGVFYFDKLRGRIAAIGNNPL